VWESRFLSPADSARTYVYASSRFRRHPDLLRVVPQPAEERLVIEVLGGGLAGADGVDEVAERRA
jgi:hypothetical protein